MGNFTIVALLSNGCQSSSYFFFTHCIKYSRTEKKNHPSGIWTVKHKENAM